MDTAGGSRDRRRIAVCVNVLDVWQGGDMMAGAEGEYYSRRGTRCQLAGAQRE